MKTFEELFDKYVPECGACETLGGEIIRAVNKLHYRYYNDGDTIGVGYGNETCNAPARFLEKVGNMNIYLLIEKMWKGGGLGYASNLEMLKDEAIKYTIEGDMFSIKNNDDMLNYQTPDDEYYYEDEYDEVYA